MENQKFLVSHCVPTLKNALDVLPSIKEPSKSASAPKTNESAWKLAPIVAPARKPLRLKLPVVPPGIEGVAPIARAEAVAEIEAEIDAAPVIDSRYSRRDVRCRRACRRWRGWRR